ncbi:MAG: hypothetical protein VW806_13730 [Halieaceae bacterium]
MPSRFTRLTSAFVLICSFCSITFSQSALADDLHPYLSKKHRLTVGGFWQESEASLTAAREPLEPTAVDLEAMGLKDRDTTWMVEYRFRKSPRWQYSASHYRYRQSADLTAETEFNFDSVEVEVGSALETSLTIDTYIFDAMYTLRRTQHSELAIGGGFHVLDNDVIVNSRRRVNGNETAEVERGRAALVAPLPNFRVTYFHAVSPQLSLMATAGWLSLSYEQYDGDFRYLRLKAEYLLTDALGVSAGFQFASIDAQENLDRGYNRFDVEFSGLTVGVSYAF